MLKDLLKSCVEAIQNAVEECKTMSDGCKAACAVAVTACKEALKTESPGSCSVAMSECWDAAYLLADYKDDACKAAEIAVTSCAVACRQTVYRSEKHRIFRHVRLDKSKIDRKARTVPLSFSSEYPALQRADDGLPDEMKRAAGLKDNEVYIEVLSHEPEDVDLSLLKNRGAFLDEHDEKDQIGVVEEADVDGKEKVGRAVVKLDTHEKAETRLGQMESDSRPHISAGYRYTRFLGDEKLPNGRKAKRFAWKALELSSVAIPADPTIGVARSYQDLPEVDSPQKPNAEERARKNMEPTVTVDEPRVRKDTLAAERTRAAGITTLADALIKNHGQRENGQMAEKIRSMANEAMSTDESLDAFKLRAMESVLNAKPADPVLMKDVTDPKGQKAYSILRGIQSCIARESKIPDGVEGEVHAEMTRKSKEAGEKVRDNGFQVPADAPMRVSRSTFARVTRDMTAGVFAQGGAFVPTELRLPIIELLRNEEILPRLGMQTMAGLQGNIVIPRQDAAATAYAVAETQALQDSNQILGQIALTPHRVGVRQKYSRLFLMQSAPDAEEFMRADMLAVLGLLWDRLGLNGQGAANEPLGVMNTPGISSIVFGATPTYAKIVAMETAVRKANVRTANAGPLTYISTPGTKGNLKITPATLTGSTVVSGTSNALWTGNEDEGRMNGYPAYDTNQVPNDQILLGAFRQLIRALWGGLSVIVDPYTLAGQDEYAVTMNSYGDFAVRHPQAFCLSADSGAQ